MPRIVWLSPTNFATIYVTGLVNDPGVPSGYILTSGSDNAADRDQQTYEAGVNSGGFPAYAQDATQNAQPQGWINGIFGGYGGGKVNGP